MAYIFNNQMIKLYEPNSGERAFLQYGDIVKPASETSQSSYRISASVFFKKPVK